LSLLLEAAPRPRPLHFPVVVRITYPQDPSKNRRFSLPLVFPCDGSGGNGWPFSCLICHSGLGNLFLLLGSAIRRDFWFVRARCGFPTAFLSLICLFATVHLGFFPHSLWHRVDGLVLRSAPPPLELPPFNPEDALHVCALVLLSFSAPWLLTPLL